MAEIITGPFHMDEQGFLATIEELIERFDGYSSGKYFAELGKIHDEYGEIGPLSLFDEKVCELGKELFCSTSWVANLAWAMISFDYDLVEHDANFLDGCRNIVRKYGMSVWLYEMINDASMAVALQRPSSRMPFQIGLTCTKDVFRRSKKKGGKYVTGKKKRLACMAEYLQEVYWLAAYSLLRWGEEEPRAAEVALMVLGYGGIGMCMLRNDPKVVDSGCDEDFSYRNLCDHLRDLRIQADLDYACNADLAESMLLEYPACMDARYLYDAGKIVEAYRVLWNKQTESASQIMERVYQKGAYQVTNIWEDPLYLHDLALSLLGAVGSRPLTEGFRTRDDKMFQQGVESLRRTTESVKGMGLVMTLGGYICFPEPESRDDALFAPRKEKKQLMDTCNGLRDLSTMVALYRFPRDVESLRATRALLAHDAKEYIDLMDPYMGSVDETGGNEERPVSVGD